MSISYELRYPSSSLSEISTQKILSPCLKKIKQLFSELSRGQAWRAEGQTGGDKDRPADRQTDAGNDNYPPSSRWYGLKSPSVAFYATQIDLIEAIK